MPARHDHFHPAIAKPRRPLSLIQLSLAIRLGLLVMPLALLWIAVLWTLA